MLLGRDGQLYVVDPFNTYSSSSEALSPSSQKIREDNIKDLKEWRKTSLNTLRVFDQNQGMHAILVDKAMLERDPAFEAPHPLIEPSALRAAKAYLDE
jgi:hypothetical protein